jgi:hypothetical protein
MERELCEKNVWPIDVQRYYGKGKQEAGRAPIFVVEEVHVIVLHKPPCLVDPARKS